MMIQDSVDVLGQMAKKYRLDATEATALTDAIHALRAIDELSRM